MSRNSTAPYGSTSRPKILQCCAVDFTVAHFLLPLMRAQREWGFDVHFACAPGPFTSALEAEGFGFHPIDVRRNFDLIAHVRAYRQLLHLASREGFIAVHVHTPVAAMLGRPAARRSGVPVVLYTAHGFYFHEGMASWNRSAHIRLERWAQRYADFLLTQSAEDAASAVEQGIASPERVQVISNGVNLERFCPAKAESPVASEVRREWEMAGAAPLVLMLGRCVREKGYSDLLEAWKRVHADSPEARLLCVAPELESDREGYAAEARALAARPGLEGSVLFTGFRDDIPRLMRAADLFVLPSWREGMPRSILEAMASGLPVVATRIRGSREEVTDGKTGLLVPPHDPRALAEALIQLLRDPSRRREMGRDARIRAEEEFDEAQVLELQREVYRRIFAEKGLAWPDADA